MDCRFCSEFDNGKQPEKGPGLGRIVWCDDDFVLVPARGPLTPHHSLLIPIRHATSFGGMPERMRRRAEMLVEVHADRLSADVTRVLVFEHGTRNENAPNGGCGIVHAHIHLVPVPSNAVLAPLPDCGTSWRALPQHRWLDELGVWGDYLVVYALDRSIQAASTAGKPIESQLLRRWLAAVLGVEWDWRKASRHWDMAGQVAALRGVYRSPLPARHDLTRFERPAPVQLLQ